MEKFGFDGWIIFKREQRKREAKMDWVYDIPKRLNEYMSSEFNKNY